MYMYIQQSKEELLLYNVQSRWTSRSGWNSYPRMELMGPDGTCERATGLELLSLAVLTATGHSAHIGI